MRSTRRTFWGFGRPVSSTILFLLLTLTTTMIARAAPDDADDGDVYDVKARVVRVSLITGNVNLKRNGSADWERARLNTPLVEGDTISTDAQARVEIQIDARNFVRLGANSVLRIVTLRDAGVALSVVEGTASVRLARFDRDHEYFEVDAPKTTLAAEKKGLYRIDVTRDGRVRLSTRDGARARIYSETSGFALRDGRTAELVYEGANAGDWEFVAATAADSWDHWVDNRERYLQARLRYEVQYYDNYLWGGEDLDAYGDWAYANDYGWIWRPHATVVNNYYNWAPYRYGSWVWISPYGWTWVGQEPWGWAPYHYGRWVYYNNYWAWSPRSSYYHQRSWWRPALVAFHISFGDNICWYPLQYHQRDPYSHYYGSGRPGYGPHDNRPQENRLRPLRADEIARLQRVNPAYYRAVTAQAARDFGSDGNRTRPADDLLARRTINAEPLRTDLPVRPAYAAADRAVASRTERTERVTIARPARVAPPREQTERPTGAAARLPGVKLDNELRRSRVLNGREARQDFPTPTAGAAGAIETRPTGAVARPTRTEREIEPRVDPRNDAGRDSNRVSSSEERPGRIERTRPREAVPVRPEVNEGNERERARPERTERSDRPDRQDRPARERNDRPDQPAQSGSSESPARVERPERHTRPEAPRYEPPPRNDPPPRSDPPSRSEPAPRSDPPPRNDPPPRSDPPSRSEPAPRSDPPPRNDPPPQRSEDKEDRVPAKIRDPR